MCVLVLMCGTVLKIHAWFIDDDEMRLTYLMYSNLSIIGLYIFLNQGDVEVLPYFTFVNNTVYMRTK